MPRSTAKGRACSGLSEILLKIALGEFLRYTGLDLGSLNGTGFMTPTQTVLIFMLR